MIVPKCLIKGDRIAIVSPASIVNPDYIDGASRFFEAEGFVPVVMPHAKGPACGSYAASDAGRLEDLVAAYRDPEVRAILCARGGYGCNHLIGSLSSELLTADPKWLMGFSDVSALHAFSEYAGVVSLHSPMAKHLTLMPADHYCTRALIGILTEGLPLEYKVDGNPLNRPGSASGRLVGGNFAVINGLAATPFDPCRANRHENVILLIEDIGEQIYEIERMLIRLRLSGRLDTLAGMIVGSFTDYSCDRNHDSMYDMINKAVSERFPITFGFPVGHTYDNLPLPIGANVTMTVSTGETTLRFSN